MRCVRLAAQKKPMLLPLPLPPKQTVRETRSRQMLQLTPHTALHTGLHGRRCGQQTYTVRHPSDSSAKQNLGHFEKRFCSMSCTQCCQRPRRCHTCVCWKVAAELMSGEQEEVQIYKEQLPINRFVSNCDDGLIESLATAADAEKQTVSD